jgi:hypothetical protein
MEIKQLYQEHKGKISDKWTLYLAEFDRLFLPYKNKDVRLFEIGIQNGGSLEIWAKYFGNAKVIIGCDIDSKCAQLRYEDNRIVVIAGDANLLDCQKRIIQCASRFDIIIDDASHKSGDIIRSFSKYFPCLESAGIYIVEDLHCSYWNDFEGGLYNPFSSISFFKRLVDIVNYEHWRNEKPRVNLYKEFIKKYELELDDSTLAEIHSIEFINSLCVIKKLPPEDNKLGRRLIAGLEESVTNGCRQLNGISVSEMAMNVSDTENYDVIELIKKINLFTQG